MPEYQGVRTDHPRIVEAIKTLLEQHKGKDEIAKIVGMPREVVDSVERQTKR